MPDRKYSILAKPEYGVLLGRSIEKTPTLRSRQVSKAAKVAMRRRAPQNEATTGAEFRTIAEHRGPQF